MNSIRKGQVQYWVKVIMIFLLVIAIFAALWVVGKKVMINAIKNYF